MVILSDVRIPSGVTDGTSLPFLQTGDRSERGEMKCWSTDFCCCRSECSPEMWARLGPPSRSAVLLGIPGAPVSPVGIEIHPFS